MHIGIAGTGRMGTAFARRLLGLGHRVTVWNRTPATAQAAVDAGAQLAATPKELVESVEILVSILTDAQALESVYAGQGGIFDAELGGRVLVEMSTSLPQSQRDLASRVADRGAAYVECPVSGSVAPALEGKLLGFAGGKAEDVARARPLLELLCRRVEHVGPVGAGASVKLAVNLPLMVYWQALGESLSLIEDLKLDPQRVVDILSETSGGPNMLKSRGPQIARALGTGDSGMTTVNVATMRKDLRAMLQQGDALRRKLPVTASTLACFDRAAADGVDASDCTQLPVWWLRVGGRAVEGG